MDRLYFANKLISWSQRRCTLCQRWLNKKQLEFCSRCAKKVSKIQCIESARRSYLNHREECNRRARETWKYYNPLKRRERYLKNKEEVLKQSREWNTRNKGRYNEIRRLWCKNNRDKCNTYKRNNRLKNKLKEGIVWVVCV